MYWAKIVQIKYSNIFQKKVLPTIRLWNDQLFQVSKKIDAISKGIAFANSTTHSAKLCYLTLLQMY